MKHGLCITITLLALASATEVTPVQKVIQLMNEMLEKGKQEKHAEEVQFAAFDQFCKDTNAEKVAAIAEAEKHIEVLTADIFKAGADIKRLAKEIAGHKDEIAGWDGEVKGLTKVRKHEKSEYEKMHKDYSESISALERAIDVLKKQEHDRKQAAFVQVSALKSLTLIPDDAKNAIDTFLAQDTTVEDLASEAPEANAYEFQSGGIVEMLEKLLDKFRDERQTLEKEEMNSQHAYDMMAQDLNGQIAQAETDVDEKSATKAKRTEDKATAEQDKADTTAQMEEDKVYLKDLIAQCEKKSTDFAARQQLRAEEIEAIEKAIEIISSEAVKGNSEKHLPQLVQTSFAQLRADARSPLQDRAMQYLQTQAATLNSPVLSALATRVASDPFRKVKKMIKDLITRLMEEANEEAEHKAWCDTEVSSNEQTRKEKTSAVETLRTEIDQLTADNAKLTQEIEALTAQVAELQAAMNKATALRTAERNTNEQTISDAKDAQSAVKKALAVLKEFYAKAAEATSFVQQTPPEIFNDDPYTGMQGAKGGVIGMLEVILADFARLETETRTAEQTNQAEHEKFMTDSSMDKAAKDTDIDHKTEKRQDNEGQLTAKNKDLVNTQKELDAALAYYDKLKPSCIDAGVSYEDRVARRAAEIQSLKEALKILSGEELR